MSKVQMGLLAALALIAVVTLLVAALGWFGGRQARRGFARERDDVLGRGRSVAEPAIEGPTSALPPPVVRYLAVLGAPSRPSLKVAQLEQRGRLRTGPDQAWMSFSAEQVYTREPPAFLWLARARVGPLLDIWARDRFVDGHGHMLVRLLGLITVADGRGPKIDQGAALRFWGEAISFPEIVTSRHLRWEPIDERSARLVATQGTLEVAATVDFAGDGLVTAVHAERYRDVGGRSILTPWSGRFTDWKIFDGRRFPARWESIWHLAEGDFSAVEIEVLRVRVE